MSELRPNPRLQTYLRPLYAGAVSARFSPRMIISKVWTGVELHASSSCLHGPRSSQSRRAE